MSVIYRILWAQNRPRDHYNHLHVEGDPVFVGRTDGSGVQPPRTNPGPTPPLEVVLEALDWRFPDWPSLGVYNRRPVSGTTVWSQHAYANAVDVGPIYGVDNQLPYYNFLNQIGETFMEYRGVNNVPIDGAGNVKEWAKNVIDWGIDVGLIETGDNNPEDWNRPLTDGRYWTFEHRRRAQ